MTDNESRKTLERRQAEEDAHDIELQNYLNRIGAKSLAQELGTLRFRNRVVEAQRWLDYHEARISFEEQFQDKLDQRIMSHQSMLFDKSQAYINFIVTLGYAGFFAIWNLVKDFMHPWDMKIVAICLGTSLLIFITWTLIAMLASTASVNRVAKAIRENQNNRDELAEAVELAERENLKRGLWLQIFWRPTFIASVLTGFLSGITLLIILLFDVIGHKFTLHGLFFGSQ